MRLALRTTSATLVGVALLLLGTSCAGGESTTGGSQEIRILFANLTGAHITVTLSGPSFSAKTVSPALCTVSGCTTGEYAGDIGDAISFTASVAGASGSGLCVAGPDMVGTPGGASQLYGSVEFRLSGTTITVSCGFGWQ